MGDVEGEVESEVARLGTERGFTSVAGARQRGLEAIYMDVVQRIGAYGRRHLCLEDALDVMQDAALELWKRWHGIPAAAFNPPQNLQAFAERVARNHIVNLVKRRKRWVDIVTDDTSLKESEEPRSADLHEEMMARDLEALLYRHHAEMPAKMRAAYELHMAGETYPEMARQLGCTESTARSHVSNAKRILAEAGATYLQEGT
jgi:RNA polymerase sigma factor (sigma-70 family)